MIFLSGAKGSFLVLRWLIWLPLTKSRTGGAYDLWNVSLGSMGRFQDLPQISCREWKDYKDGSGPDQLLKKYHSYGFLTKKSGCY
jgi:hypothetical protein